MLLMGPLYHLLDKADRETVVNASLSCLKQDGYLFASFIQIFSEAINALAHSPDIFLKSESDKEYTTYLSSWKSWPYSGNDGFTAAYFITPEEVVELMSNFPIERKHLFAQEGIISTKQLESHNWDIAVRDKWMDIAYSLCERPELLGYSEHLMYIGQKR